MKSTQLRALSLATLEEKTGFDRARLSRIFNGQRTSEKTLEAIAIALDMNPVEVYRQILEIRQEKQQ